MRPKKDHSNTKKFQKNSWKQWVPNPECAFFFWGGSFFCLSINNLFFSNDTFLEIHHPFGSSNADSTCALASSKSAAKTCGGIIVTQSATWPRDTACYWTNIQKRNTQRKTKTCFISFRKPTCSSAIFHIQLNWSNRNQPIINYLFWADFHTNWRYAAESFHVHMGWLLKNLGICTLSALKYLRPLVILTQQTSSVAWKVGIGSFHYVHIESYALIILYICIVLSYFQTGPPNSRNKHMCHEQKEHVAQDWLFRCPQQATGISDWCAIFGFQCFHCSLGCLVTCRNQESHVGMAKQWRTCWCFEGGPT